MNFRPINWYCQYKIDSFIPKHSRKIARLFFCDWVSFFEKKNTGFRKLSFWGCFKVAPTPSLEASVNIYIYIGRLGSKIASIGSAHIHCFILSKLISHSCDQSKRTFFLSRLCKGSNIVDAFGKNFK